MSVINQDSDKFIAVNSTDISHLKILHFSGSTGTGSPVTSVGLNF